MIILKNATLIDGSGAPPLNNAVIVVRGDKIESVTSNVNDADDECLSNAKAEPESADSDIIIDLKGKYLLPGLIDLHVHFGGTDGFEYPGLSDRKASYDFLHSRLESLKWGVTTVRSAGDFTPDIFDLRDEVDAGKHISPRIIAAGKMIQAKGGHPLSTVFSGLPEIAENACVLVDENTDIAVEIGTLVSQGADWIKAYISEVNKLDYPARIPRISGEKIKKIVEISHKLDKPCMIHVDNISQMREAAEAGADTIEHVFAIGSTDTEIDDSLIQLLKEKGITVVPTLISIKKHDNMGENMPRVYNVLLDEVRKLVDCGVIVGVGTDSPIPFNEIGESLHEEMAELVNCGMSPLEAITAATSGNARILRMSDKIGRISPLLLADLIVVDGNPLDDIENTKNISLVVANGKIVLDNI